MAKVNVYDAKAGKPVARLVPVEEKVIKRIPGSAKGLIVMKNSFLEPLPEDILEVPGSCLLCR